MIGDPVAHERLGGADLQFILVAGFQAQGPDPGFEHRIAQFAPQPVAHRAPRRRPVRPHRFSRQMSHRHYPSLRPVCGAVVSWRRAFARPLLTRPASAVCFSSHAFPLQDCFQGRPCRLPAIVCAAMALAVEIALEAARDIEGLCESPPASSPWRRRANARPSGRETAPACPVRARSRQRAGWFRPRNRDWAPWWERPAIRCNAPGGPGRRDRAGRRKFHSATVRTSTSWALGSLFSMSQASAAPTSPA